MELRYRPRASFQCPVVFACDSSIGEGTILNLSTPGCAIESKMRVAPGNYLRMHMLLPDQSPSLPVGLAAVRWVDGYRFGVEFIRIPKEQQMRLVRFLMAQIKGMWLQKSGQNARETGATAGRTCQRT